RFIKEGELSCNLVQFFCMPSETLLVCQADLLDQILIVMLQLIQTVLHLKNDTVFCLHIHVFQLFGCKFLTHTDDRLSCKKVYQKMRACANHGRKTIRHFALFSGMSSFGLTACKL